MHCWRLSNLVMAVRNQSQSIHISTVSQKKKKHTRSHCCLSSFLGGHRGRCGIPTVSPPVQVGEESAASIRNGG